MNAKEKAKQIFKKMYLVDDAMDNYPMCFVTAKQCALIAVDEILRHHSQEQGLYRIDTYYWQQVKSELQSF